MNIADLRIEKRDGVVIACIVGEVDLSNADQLRKGLVGSMTNEAFGLVIDLSDVAYLDSAGIHVLYEIREQLKKRGQGLRLVVPPGAPAGKALEIAGVRSAVSVADALDTAVEEIDGMGREGPGKGT